MPASSTGGLGPTCDLRYSLTYTLRGGKWHHGGLGVSWSAGWATHEVDHRKRDSRYLSRSSSRSEEICRILEPGIRPRRGAAGTDNGTANNALTWGWDRIRDRTGNASGNSTGNGGTIPDRPGAPDEEAYATGVSPDGPSRRFHAAKSTPAAPAWSRTWPRALPPLSRTTAPRQRAAAIASLASWSSTPPWSLGSAKGSLTR